MKWSLLLLLRNDNYSAVGQVYAVVHPEAMKC